jgi:hypothetical protein
MSYPLAAAAARSDPFRFIRLVQQSRLPPTLRYFLLNFVTWGNWDNGTGIRPGLETLMSATGLARPTVLRCLKQLTDAGIIKRDGAAQRIRQYCVDPVAILQYDPARHGPARRPSGWTDEDRRQRQIDRSRGGDLSAPIGLAAETYQPVENSPIGLAAETLPSPIGLAAETYAPIDRSRGGDGKVSRRRLIGLAAETDRSRGGDAYKEDHSDHLDHPDHTEPRAAAPVENSRPPAGRKYYGVTPPPPPGQPWPPQPDGELIGRPPVPIRGLVAAERHLVRLRRAAASAFETCWRGENNPNPTPADVGKHFDEQCRAIGLRARPDERTRAIRDAIADGRRGRIH